MEKGLLHLYWGEGKGKTTAAAGLAVRALGCGRRVTFVQFLKDGSSHELGAAVFSEMEDSKFVFQMTPEEKAAACIRQTELLRRALAAPCDLLVLDEACAAWMLDTVDRDLLRQAVLERPAGCEAVLTGRDPAPWMRRAADYSTEMRCHRHPFEQGIPAREGIEY